jgi:hypothetical protein
VVQLVRCTCRRKEGGGVAVGSKLEREVPGCDNLSIDKDRDSRVVNNDRYADDKTNAVLSQHTKIQDFC